MSAATRLDPVVRLREKAQEHAQLALAQRTRAVHAAADALGAASARAANDGRTAGDASTWQLAEDAHFRALVEVRTAQTALASARVIEEEARAACVTARQRTEAVSRARERKREEQRQTDARGERKQLDELALLLRAG